MSVRQRHPTAPSGNKQHPIVQLTPLNTRYALYGGRTEAMVLHYATREGETIQYSDIMSLYPFVSKYFKFQYDTLKFIWATRVVINKLCYVRRVS